MDLLIGLKSNKAFEKGKCPKFSCGDSCRPNRDCKEISRRIKNEISEDIKERALQRINYGDITEVKFVPEN